MELRSTFGHWIKQRRKARGLTQAQLAQRVGCSVSLIIKLEADRRRPSNQIAERLADILAQDATDRMALLRLARVVADALPLGLPP
jgi:transcriptional regulator with XRE-family HTH domain